MNRLHRTKLCLPAILGLLALAPALAAGNSDRADRTLADVQRWLDETRTLAGRFEQSLLSGALGASTVESGAFWLHRPGRMRWDYERPEVKVALLLDGRTELYLEEDRELFRGRLDDEGELLPTLLAGGRPLADLFEAAIRQPTEDGRIRLELRPRDDADEFRMLLLTLDRAGRGIEEVDVLDSAGNRVRYAFQEVSRNEDLPTGVFHFEPPAGTRISGEAGL